MITIITGSHDLAEVLNAEPLTEADAAETPRDWLAGIWVAGTVYQLDPQETTETLAVLAGGHAAVRWSPKGEQCLESHTTVNSEAPHWCPADTDSWTWGEEVRGVRRDWRSVTVWDANGFLESATYPTLEAAVAAFNEDVTQIRTGSAPQVTDETLRELLAGPDQTVLSVSMDGSGYLELLLDEDPDDETDSDDDSGPYGDDTDDALVTVVSRAEVVEELGESPTTTQIVTYLTTLQELVADAAERL